MAGVTLAWFVPMTLVSGGLTAYFGSLAHLWLMVPGQRTTLDNPALAVARLVTIAWIFVMCFGAAGLAAFRRGSEVRAAGADRTRFTWIWLAPGLLFFTFVFLNYVNSGYLLVLCPPVFAFLARPHSPNGHAPAAADSCAGRRWRPGRRANCAFFLFAPVYCSHQGVREFERDMKAVSEQFRKAVRPANHARRRFRLSFPRISSRRVLSSGIRDGPVPGSRISGWETRVRHAGRRYATGEPASSGPLRAGRLLPVAAGAEYSAYLDTVLKRLPQDALSKTHHRPEERLDRSRLRHPHAFSHSTADGSDAGVYAAARTCKPAFTACGRCLS